MTEREALKLALDFIGRLKFADAEPEPERVMEAIKEALSSPNGEAQPEQPSARTGNCLLTGVCASEGHKIQKAQPEQEPVAWVCEGSASDEKHAVDYQQEDIDAIPVGTMLYTTPPQPQNEVRGNLSRKPLTDEEMDAVIDGCPKYHGRFSTKDPDGKLNYYELIRAIEAAHGIKGDA